MKTTRQNVSFKAGGRPASGWLCVPAGDQKGPGVLVVQEWWGLTDDIRYWCQRLADAGFVALAPDLYHGQIAEHTGNNSKHNSNIFSIIQTRTPFQQYR